MPIFLNIFIKTLAYFISIIFVFLLLVLLINFVNDRNKNEFTFLYGDKDSTNIISIIELNGLIIEKNRDFSEFTNAFIISPNDIKNHLEDLKNISPNIIIFSINSPGGTVSASKNLYDIIKNFKKNNDVEILFHTNELLASGGYWVSSAADKIFANYGSIIGSIGVKGPDWFFYDQPKSISTGIFGNKIETKESIKIYSSKAGKSKDIFNPFRKPTNQELNHLQKMVDGIYDDFIRTISKERKIEANTLNKEIGALIYTSDKAVYLNLIDGELSLDNLINKIIKEKDFKTYKVIKKFIKKNSLFREILTSIYYKSNLDIKYECLQLRSSISAILSYQSTGC